MKIGSLFSGIGGLDLGVEAATDGRVIWQAESDPFCQQVLARHWPDAKLYSDVRNINDQTEVPTIICGGFPCQDVSNAGRRLGIDGPQSGLWREFARIVRILAPAIVIVENVSALCRRGLDRVLGDLADCGYDAEWSCLRAADVGAPHIRRRLFLVAIRAALPYTDREQVRVVRERCRQQRELPAAAQPGIDGSELADADADGLGTVAAPRKNGGRSSRDDPARRLGWPPGPNDQPGWESWRRSGGPEPDVRRVSDGASDWLDRTAALGNAVVPRQAEVAVRALMLRYET